MSKVIIFNANRPRAGKDLATSIMKAELEGLDKKVQILTFKDALVELTARFFKLKRDEFLEDYDTQLGNGTWHKDLRTPKLNLGQHGNMSQREALIHVSEKVLKPILGLGVFGKMLNESIDNTADYVLVSDSGFIEEICEISTKHEVHLVSVFADYVNMGGVVKDSRNFFTKEELGDNIKSFHKVLNNSSQEDFELRIKHLVHNCLK